MRALSRFVTVVLLLGAVTFAGQEAKREAATSLEGVVLSASGSQPIAGARLTLLKDPGIITRSGTNQDLEIPQELDWHYISTVTFTDAAGHFSFINMDSKVYGLVVGANGYVRQEFEREDFPTSGKPLVIRMTATGAVTGVVRAESGRPLPGVDVQLMKFTYDDDGRRSWKGIHSVKTNDRGAYRLFYITPGRYFLRAGNAGIVSSDGFADHVAPLFFPGAVDAGDAQVIEINSGSEQSGVDFRLRPQALFQIRGRVTGASALPMDSHVVVRLFYLGGGFSVGADSSGIWRGVNLTADNSFQIKNMPPGVYALTADTDSIQALVSVRVVNSDIENVELAVGTATVRGHIQIEGTAPAGEVWSQIGPFRLRPILWESAIAESFFRDQTEIESKLTENKDQFILEDVLPVDYRLELDDIVPRGYYVKSARYGGVDLMTKPFHYAGGGETLDIVVNSNAGAVSGTVVDEKGEAIRKAIVALVPDRARERADLYEPGPTDREGHFSFERIPPGDYKIFAWRSIEENSWFDPDVIRRDEPKATPIRVTESSKQTIRISIH